MIVEPCPKCDSPELDMTFNPLTRVTDCSCGHCGWKGTKSEVDLHFDSEEKLEGVNELANDMLNVVTTSLIGPLTAVLERRGLLPVPLKIVGGYSPEATAKFDALLDEERGKCYRAVTAAVIAAAFDSCAESHPILQAARPPNPEAS